MTSIDFHFNTPDRLQYACRLVRKIINGQQATPATPLAGYCSNEARFNDFDDLLWNFSETDFLPHVHAENPLAEETPILLLDKDIALPCHHILLNLDDEPPSFFSKFVRLLEVVSTDEADKSQARERFTFYRDRGYAIQRYDLSKSAS